MNLTKEFYEIDRISDNATSRKYLLFGEQIKKLLLDDSERLVSKVQFS